MGRRSTPLVHTCVCGATKAWYADRLPYGLCLKCRRQKKAAAVDPGYHRAYSLQHKYGITVADFDARLEAQGGGCAICGRSDVQFHVDHDHESLAIRGILCLACNMAIGLLHDDPERVDAVAAYLRSYEPSARPVFNEPWFDGYFSDEYLGRDHGGEA